LKLCCIVVRVFIAVSVPDAIRGAIARAQEELRRAVSDDEIRWAKPEQFHLTLKFLGNVDDSRLEELKEAVGKVSEGFSPLGLRAAGIGFFPQGRPPRVVWAGVDESNNRLVALWKALESAMRPFNNEKAEQNFNGHITLARVGRLPRAHAEALVKAADRFEKMTFGEWTAGHVELMRSELSPQGARHTVLAALLLGGSSGVME
jgi:2'-5' RNA ligase